jgi:hypothetical protein
MRPSQALEFVQRFNCWTLHEGAIGGGGGGGGRSIQTPDLGGRNIEIVSSSLLAMDASASISGGAIVFGRLPR